MNRLTIKGYFCIIASAVIFGCMPLGVKLIYAEGVNSLSMVLLRNFLPLPFLALLAVRGGGSLKLPKGALNPAIQALHGSFVLDQACAAPDGFAGKLSLGVGGINACVISRPWEA